MVNLLRIPLHARTGGMHSCLYPSRHGYANLRWQDMLPAHLPDMCHEPFGGESPQVSPIAMGLTPPFGLGSARRLAPAKAAAAAEQGKPGPEQAAQPQRPGAGKGHQLLQLQWPHASAARATQKVQGSVSGEGPQGLGHRTRHQFRSKRQIMHRAGTRLRVGRVQAAKSPGCCWRVRAKAR